MSLLVLNTYFQHEYIGDHSQGFVPLGLLCSQKLNKLVTILNVTVPEVSLSHICVRLSFLLVNGLLTA